MAPPGTTSRLVEGVLRWASSGLPPDVASAARSRLLATLAAAISASHHPLVDTVVEVWDGDGDAALTPVLGRSERLTLLSSATASGAAAWLGLAGADTAAEVGPDATVMSAVVPLGWLEDVPGERLLTAFALGCEVQTRLAAALPSGDDHCWTRSGPSGPVAAAVAAGLLLDLPATGIQAAMGIASSQLLGQRESAGTALEPFTAGKAAANGMHAALLARDGLTAPLDILEHPRGFFAVLALGADRPEVLLDGLGEHWQWLEEWPDGIEGAIAATEPVPPRQSRALVDAVEALEGAPSVRQMIRAASRAEVAG